MLGLEAHVSSAVGVLHDRAPAHLLALAGTVATHDGHPLSRLEVGRYIRLLRVHDDLTVGHRGILS